MYRIYRHLKFSSSDSSGLFGSTNICPLQNNPIEISGICMSKVLCIVWSVSHWDRIINSKQTPGSRSRTRQNSRWYIYWYSWFQTVDVNHNHKATYSVQLLVLSIYTCLTEAHKASNSALLLFSWAEERSSSSSLFMYWMLIIKFQINYLLFIRFMREHNFKSFVKTLIFLVKRFFIFDHYNYNFAVQISRR